uniref:FLYWCH-type domain-containing protein n=1 Tax=Meloidogyne hapla TaxID=6305 RepID=A0A1I8BFF5_MELHA
MATFGSTKRNNDCLNHCGLRYIYKEFQKTKKRYIWECDKKRNPWFCKGKVFTMDKIKDTEVSKMKDHTHPSCIEILKKNGKEENEEILVDESEFVHVLNFDEEDEEEYGDDDVVDLFVNLKNNNIIKFNENILNFDEDEEEDDDDNGENDEIGEQNNELLELREKNVDLNGAKNRLEIQLKSKINQAFELKINDMEINKIELNKLNDKLKSELQSKIDTIKLMELSHAEIVEKLRKELEDVKNENAKLDKNLNVANKT